MSRRTHRRRAREVAMQALFQLDQNPQMRSEDIQAFVAAELKFPELEEFTRSLVDGTRANQQDIDAIITSAATNWRLDRMAAVDRAVLRLAVFELCFAAEPTPSKVVISEAVEICKRFSTAASSRFVNGVLNKVAALETGS